MCTQISTHTPKECFKAKLSDLSLQSQDLKNKDRRIRIHSQSQVGTELETNPEYETLAPKTERGGEEERGERKGGNSNTDEVIGRLRL